MENLAVVNYDTNNLYLAPYDWRLSYYNLEERDGYFSRLKTTIEGLRSALRGSMAHCNLMQIFNQAKAKAEGCCRCAFNGLFCEYRAPSF